MNETTWFILCVWLIFLLFSYARFNIVIRGLAGIIGLFYSVFYLTSVATWLMFIILLFNIYVLYTAFWQELGGKT